MRLFSFMLSLAVVTVAASAPECGAAASSGETKADGGTLRPRLDATNGMLCPSPSRRAARCSMPPTIEAAVPGTGPVPVRWREQSTGCHRHDPECPGLSQVSIYRKPDFAMRSEAARAGDEDPGAGQIMRELWRPDGRALGSIHSVNPGILGNARDTSLPTLSSMTVGGEVTPCRWTASGRVLFVDDRRTVVITAEANGSFTYRSFDHARHSIPVGGTSSIATATVRGGRLIRSPPGLETYGFSAGPWTYRVKASADDRQPGATLTVLRSGRATTSSMAVAYEMAAARRE